MTVTPKFQGFIPLLSFCLGIGIVSGALAASPDDKKVAKATQERIQRLQQAQQSLEQEKGQLSAEKAGVERQLSTTKSELNRARAAARREAVALSELATIRLEKEALDKRLVELDTKLLDSSQKLQAAAEADARARKVLLVTQRELEVSKKSLTSCESQNQGLYKLNIDLLGRYEKASGSGGLLSGGPLTQFGRVRMENESVSYQDRIDDLKVASPAKPQ
jgi:chromosome segregation ATPase